MDERDYKSMNKPDFTGGDHSFNNWFKIMWQNNYVQIFTVALILSILEVVHYDWIQSLIVDTDGDKVGLTAVILGVMIFPTIVLLVSYLGFYKYWKDLKNGNGI